MTRRDGSLGGAVLVGIAMNIREVQAVMYYSTLHYNHFSTMHRESKLT